MTSCPACGTDNRAGARFCDSCGASLAQPAPTREVRKTVTVLFADVVDSTAAGEERDPEAVRAQMGRWFEQARATIERHGGTVEKFAGDSVMAVFGVPVVHEDDALRAVRSADELRSSELRIGVNTGEVVAGEGETMVTGDAVNVAARLEQAAAPGEVLIGSETRRLVRDAAEVEQIEPLDLKGKAEPVEAYRLLAVREGAEAIARHLEAPLVGRKRELERLRQDFEHAVAEQSCHLFTLLGPAGVGKSRLVAEFLAGTGARVVRGRCLSYGEGITYYPVVEVMIQLSAEPDSILGASPAETQLSFRKLLEREATDGPLIVVFDDIQWAEPTFLDLVEHIADLSRGVPIFLLCIARSELLELRPTWGGGKLNTTTILLEPLSEAECEQLISTLGGTDAELQVKVIEASQGNPLFVEEMLAMLREGGDVTVPPTIHALLHARLDALGREERAVMERGAVEGQVFHRGAVLELAPEMDVDAQLPALVRKELIRPDTPAFPDDDAYRFRHLLIRDAAYEGLPKETRAELHERFALWLDQHAALVEQDEIVGYHLEQAALYRRELDGADEELDRRASERLGAGGRAARDHGDASAAIGLLQRAASLLPAGDAARHELRLDSLEPLRLAGRFDDARAALAELASSGDERLEARATVAEIELASQVSSEVRLDEARERLAAAAATLTRVGGDEDLAHAALVGGGIEWFANQTSACAEQAETAMVHAARAGVQWLEAAAVIMLGGALVWGPTPLSEAERELAHLQERAKGGPALEASLSRQLGRCATLRGDFDRARSLIQAGVAALEELGQQMLAAANRGFSLGLLAWLDGDYAEAERVHREAYEKLTALGEQAYASTLALFLAAVLLELGRDDEAAFFLEETRRLTSPGDMLNQIGGDAVEALILARRGECEPALELGRRAVARTLQTDSFEDRAWTYELVSKARVRCGRAEEARQLLERMLAESEAKEATAYVKRARELIAEL